MIRIIKEKIANNPTFNIFKSRKVLITGGLGFIGSTLAHALVKLNANVVLIDNLIPEHGGHLFNVADINNKLKINIADVRDPDILQKLIKGQDYLFNLVGQTSHLDSMRNPIADLEVNSKAQLYILEACRKYNSKIKIIFTSTRQIYGIPQYFPVDEKHPLQPVDINGVNKLSGEWYHILYNKVYSIKTVVLRLTNTYGPRMRIKDARQTFLGEWIKNILKDKALEVWGGQQLRDFNYVDDVVNALLLCAVSNKSSGKIFNLGSKRVVSLKELAEILIKINKKGEFIIKDYPAARKKIDIGNYYANYNAINSLLGWDTSIELEDGLNRTINYYRTCLSKYL